MLISLIAAMLALAPPRRLTSSMRVEDALVSGGGLLDRLALGLRRVVRILGRRQAAEAHETGHQQQPRLVRREIRSGEEDGGRIGKTFRCAASGAHDRQSAEN